MTQMAAQSPYLYKGPQPPIVNGDSQTTRLQGQGNTKFLMTTHYPQAAALWGRDVVEETGCTAIGTTGITVGEFLDDEQQHFLMTSTTTPTSTRAPAPPAAAAMISTIDPASAAA
eukprot:3446411-Pyramimonas_sp.AAC.1